MTQYKQKIEAQIEFAKGRMRQADLSNNTLEVQSWSSYIQGLRFCLGELQESSGVVTEIKEPRASLPCINDCVYPNCTCDPNILAPFGECICGADYELSN